MKPAVIKRYSPLSHTPFKHPTVLFCRTLVFTSSTAVCMLSAYVVTKHYFAFQNIWLKALSGAY